MSGRSRGAQDVLHEIRRVITHLEQKDRKLNEKLKTWESFKNGDESERIKGLVEENASLKEDARQISDNSGKKMQEMSGLKDENAHLQGSISAKDAEINKLTKDLNAQKHTCDQMSHYYVEMKKDLEKSKVDLIDTRAEMNSYSSAYDSEFKEKTALQTKNSELMEIIRQLQTASSSSDQPQLQKAYDDLVIEVEKVREESKHNKYTADHNFKACDQYRALYEETKQRNQIIQEEIAKLRSGGVAASVSQSLESTDQSPASKAVKLDLEPHKDPTKDLNASEKADTQKDPGIQQRAPQHRSYIGAAVGGIGEAAGAVLNALRLGGGGGGTNSVAEVINDTRGDSGPADSEIDDRYGDGDETAAGSPSGGPDKVSPPYKVTVEVNNKKIRDNTAAAEAIGSKTQVGGGGGAAGGEGRGAAAITADGGAGGGGGHAVVDVDEIIKKATEEVEKNNVIDMLKMSLNEMKVDPRLFQYVQKTNNGALMTKRDPKTRRLVPDMHYKVLFPGMAVSGISAQQNVDAYCKSLTKEQLNALENLYDIHGSTRDESIDKLVKLKTYISSWSIILAAKRDQLIALCNNKGISYPEKTIPEIAEWFKKHARTDGLRQEIYDILDS
jgi:hypothetical protein